MREFDVIVWGASGFTGRLVSEYLLSQYGVGRDVKWAIGGRNASKLNIFKDQLGAPSLPVLVADIKNRSSLDDLTKQTKVICTTVGPYALYGSEMVASCVANGTHYCDLAGEAQWIRRMIDRHHDEARKNKTRIVHSCGFDSIPSDMGVYFLQKEAQTRFNDFTEQVTLYVKGYSGTASGGTIATMQNITAEMAKDKSIMEILNDPYSLNPEGQRVGKDQMEITKAEYDPNIDAWIGPFIMAGINTRIVRRSHALSGFKYGKDFRYEEVLITGKGWKGKLKAQGSALTFAFAQAMKPGSVFKKIGDQFLPKPGEGPTKEQQEKGFFNMMLLGKLKNGKEIKVKVTGDRDPGYGSTSKMLSEAAVCLAKDENQFSTDYGCLTPSTAMGDVLLSRLIANAGLEFKVIE